MFKRLKRRFVLNTVLLSSFVIILSFSIVYIAVNNSYQQREPHSPVELSEQMRNVFEDRIREDHEKSLQTLLITLVVTGFSIELVVFVASLWAAEASIRPVREAYEAQKTFISNASHELKTPLAVIQANLEAADIQDNHWLDNAQTKIDEAIELNNSLLNLARLDQSTPAKKSAVQLDKIVRKTADFYLPKLKKQGITLKIEAESNIKSTELPRAELSQLLNILLDNATKYADSYIDIEVKTNRVKITNDGATISKDKLSHIFDRFYQVDKTKSGVGLGLSIAKTIADKNHWRLTADSDAKSTTFMLDLA